jgi:hypothetical protein
MSHETIIHFTAKVTNHSTPHPEKKKKNHHSINVIEQIAHRLSKSNGNDIKNSQSPKTLNLHNSVK